MSVSRARRRFLLSGLAVGGGLLLGYGVFRPRDLLGDARVLPVTNGETAMNAWLKIAENGQVTVAVPRAEMGQGVYTALPMLVAEELDLDWDQVGVEQAPVDKVYGNIAVLVDTLPLGEDDQGAVARAGRFGLARVARMLGLQVTGGSSSVIDAWVPMRMAGASARAVLIAAAAARLGVPAGELSTQGGRVTHAATARSVDYGSLAAEAARLRVPDDVRCKAPADYRHIGQSRPRLDLADKCTGAARFGIDTHTDDMLHASIRIAPVLGGHLVSCDRAALAALPGVEAVHVDTDAVTVVARTWWHAERALTQATIAWSDPPADAESTTTIFARYAQALDEGDTHIYEDIGDIRAALAAGDTAAVIEAEYRAPILAHACMEPLNATVRVTADTAEIWCGNQAPDLLRLLAAQALDRAPESVVLHTPLLGGGFGRRVEGDVMLRTIAVARTLPGRTVKLVYPREQDLQHDAYRPPMLARMRGRLAADGRMAAWHCALASPSVSQSLIGRAFPRLPLMGPDLTEVEGAAFLAYRMPHRRVEHARVPLRLPVGFWRSVGHSVHAFFTESFIDELAGLAGRDPFDFRLAHLPPDSREHRVLSALRERAEWNGADAADGARGVAVHRSFGSVVGQVADVVVTGGAVRVTRVVCVVDCGLVVNPDIVVAQIESGVLYGLDAALFGDVPYDGQRVGAHNFTDHRVLRLAEAPHIVVHLLDGGTVPHGVGEPGTPPIAPAVANALAHLQGRRQRALPLRA